MRLFLYTATANPSYICLTSEDPLLEAFELAIELEKAANYGGEFNIPYRNLAHVNYTNNKEIFNLEKNIEEKNSLKTKTSFIRLNRQQRSSQWN